MSVAPENMTVLPYSTGGFDTAVDFWDWWRTDPNADQKLVCGPQEAIESTLVRTGYDPVRAASVAHAAHFYVNLATRNE